MPRVSQTLNPLEELNDKKEEWFDSKRLRHDYVPSGWKGPGVKTRAVKGHEFGLSLPAEDKRALISFLRTL